MTPFSTTSDYERAVHVIEAVLDVWDPYALRRGGAPEGEWESLARGIARHVPRIRAAEDAVRAVATEAQAAFGTADFPESSCRDVGLAIFAVLRLGDWIAES